MKHFIKKNKFAAKLIVFSLGVFLLGNLYVWGQSSEAQYKQSTGQILIADGTVGSPAIAFANDPNTGFFRHGTADTFDIVTVGSTTYRISRWTTLLYGTNLQLYNNSARLTLGYDTTANLYKDTDYTIGQRNGANAQTLRIYGTYTDTDNYERLSFSTTQGSGVTIAAETAGSGGDNLNITLTPAGTGAVLPGSNNTVDLGTSSYEWKNLYVDGIIYADYINNAGTYQAGATAAYLFASRSYMKSPSDGNILFQNNAESAFSGLYFGTQTATDIALTFIQGAIPTITIAGGDGSNVGQLLVPDGTVSYPSIGFSSINDGSGTGFAQINTYDEDDLGVVVDGATTWIFRDGGQLRHLGGQGIAMLGTNPYIEFSSMDLEREAANTLRLENGANAITFLIYGTRTDADNYERLSLSTSIGSGVTIAAETAGSGGDNLNITLTPAGTGAVLPGSDDTVDLGGSGIEFKDGWFDGTLNFDVLTGAILQVDAAKVLVNGELRLSSKLDLTAPEDGGLEICNNAEDQDRIRIYGTNKALTESTATSIATITCDTNEYVGGTFQCSVYATDGTDLQNRAQFFTFSAVNKAGTVTCTISAITENVAASAGTLTCTPTITQNGDAFDLQLNAVSSLTQTTLETRWQVRLDGNGGAVTAL